VHVTQTLTKALQASERAGSNFFVDSAVFLDTGSEADHFPQTVDYHELTVGISRHDHVEAVRAKVYGRQNVGDVAG